jgi:hypothetical protein
MFVDRHFPIFSVGRHAALYGDGCILLQNGANVHDDGREKSPFLRGNASVVARKTSV